MISTASLKITEFLFVMIETVSNLQTKTSKLDLELRALLGQAGTIEALSLPPFTIWCNAVALAVLVHFFLFLDNLQFLPFSALGFPMLCSTNIKDRYFDSLVKDFVERLKLLGNRIRKLSNDLSCKYFS